MSWNSYKVWTQKYPTLQKFKYKCDWFPVIPDQFSNCDDTIVYYIIVKYEATNMTSGRVTGYYAVSEPIAAFPELELPVPEVIFVASFLTIL